MTQPGLSGGRQLPLSCHPHRYQSAGKGSSSGPGAPGKAQWGVRLRRCSPPPDPNYCSERGLPWGNPVLPQLIINGHFGFFLIFILTAWDLYGKRDDCRPRFGHLWVLWSNSIYWTFRPRYSCSVSEGKEKGENAQTRAGFYTSVTSTDEDLCLGGSVLGHLNTMQTLDFRSCT